MVRARFECSEFGLEYTKNCLEKAVNYIKENFPHIQLVAEFVGNIEEANILFDMGFDGVQGRNLKREDFDYTAKAPEDSLVTELLFD